MKRAVAVLSNPRIEWALLAFWLVLSLAAW